MNTIDRMKKQNYIGGKAMKYPCFPSGAKRCISLLVCIFFLVQLASCGTMLYPERRGQHTNLAQLDVKVMIMDGALLFLFVLPGVIAYAVDFATGCIYLPPGQIMLNTDQLESGELSVIHMKPERMDMDAVNRAVQQHTGIMIQERTQKLRIFRPNVAQVNIRQELVRLQSGREPLATGAWFHNEQITSVEGKSYEQ